MSKHTQGKTQYTKGQWSVLPEECDKPYIRIRGTCLGGRYKIANVVTPIYEGANSQEAEETRANARLIAAAPELLEALQAALEALRGSAGFDEINNAKKHGKAAIAKATGEQA